MYVELCKKEKEERKIHSLVQWRCESREQEIEKKIGKVKFDRFKNKKKKKKTKQKKTDRTDRIQILLSLRRMCMCLCFSLFHYQKKRCIFV